MLLMVRHRGVFHSDYFLLYDLYMRELILNMWWNIADASHPQPEELGVVARQRLRQVSGTASAPPATTPQQRRLRLAAAQVSAK